MRRNLFVLASVFVASLFFSAQLWAVCPEEPFDGGECDTLHVDIHPPDQDPGGEPPYFVRFPIRVTHDVADPVFDSLAGFVIPLCFTHSNPGAYCSLSGYWNNTNLFPHAPDRSIFRDLDGETNWFWWLSQHDPPPAMPPPPVFLDLDGTSHFWFWATVWNQRFGDLDQGLIATMTFKVEDTMTVCIDSCFWPPSDRLKFGNSAAQTYVPRHYLPICEKVGPQPDPPVFTQCPPGVSHNENGAFQSAEFQVTDIEGEVVEVSAEFAGSGLSDVNVVYTAPPPMATVAGYVQYTVEDHCQAGGALTITAYDDVGWPGYCDFDVELINDPPAVTMPDTFRAIAENYIMGMIVSATDPDGDPVAIELEAFWFEDDSLQPPVNAPYLEGDNPRFFRWAPTDSDMGTWMGLFSATDACGVADSGLATILVGPLFCGDNTSNGNVDLGDAVFLLGHLFKQQPPPDPPCKSDVNCDSVTDVGDVIIMLNYLFKFGTAPCFDCCP